MTSPVHFLSIESSPPFVNRVQSTFCQSSPVHLLSIESSPPFVNRVQSTFCQSSPVHLLSIESSPPFVNRVQSTFCQSSPVHLLSIESSPPFVSPVQSTFCHMPIFYTVKSFTCAISRVANSAKANRKMTAHNEKSIICNEPEFGALHSGKTLTPPLVQLLPQISGRTARAKLTGIASLQHIFCKCYYRWVSTTKKDSI